MNYNQVREILAPCGLNCKKCVAYTQGDIAETSQLLVDLLGNFDSYAERYSRFYPVYRDYPAFKTFLEHLSNPQCEGCRNGHCLYEGCEVGNCEKVESGELDYCFECNEFPCEHPQFHPDLKQRWIERNQRMDEIGVLEYYEEPKTHPRYV